MIKNRNLFFLLVNFILGSTVILSYIWGLVFYPEYDSALWGKIDTDYIPYIIFSMFLALTIKVMGTDWNRHKGSLPIF